MTRGRLADGIALAAFGLIFVAGLAVIAVDPAAASTDRVEIHVRYSRFEPSTLVPHGRPITFVLINDDPIDHEWLIGDEQMHERHRTGRRRITAAGLRRCRSRRSRRWRRRSRSTIR